GRVGDASELPLDRGQRETERLQLADQVQPGEMFSRVQPGAPAQARWWQEPARGVEADRAHGHAGTGGQFVDGELVVRGSEHGSTILLDLCDTKNVTLTASRFVLGTPQADDRSCESGAIGVSGSSSARRSRGAGLGRLARDEERWI